MRRIETPSGRDVVAELTGETGSSPKLELDAIGKTLVSVACDSAIEKRMREQRLRIAELVANAKDTTSAAVEILRLEQ
jgi:hypothetical protein